MAKTVKYIGEYLSPSDAARHGLNLTDEEIERARSELASAFGVRLSPIVGKPAEPT